MQLPAVVMLAGPPREIRLNKATMRVVAFAQLLLVARCAVPPPGRPVGAAGGRLNVSLFYESECPYCRATVTGSFAAAMRAEGFLEMASVALYPYGNAQVRGVGLLSAPLRRTAAVHAGHPPRMCRSLSSPLYRARSQVEGASQSLDV